MFKRFVYEDWMIVFPIVAFITAACIYAYFTYRALRMKRGQIDRFANLPFNEENTS